MKLVYGTNFWSHHQAPVARELARLLGPERFRLVVFEEVDAERRALGWPEREDAPWILGPPRDLAARKRLDEECLEADVMVFGHCPREVLEARAAAGRLTLVASERVLKKPMHALRLVNPRYARGWARYRRTVNRQNVHALAVGGFAPGDLRRVGAFDDRIWRWGYFVEVTGKLPTPRPDGPLDLLWVGRMLRWKRVDTLLRAAARLAGSPRLGIVRIVGEGPERDGLRRLADRLGLATDRVRFEPAVSAQEVRRLMRASDVYVLPSNGQEGWGAVAGEAMSEGCVLVANEQAGSARDLVVHGTTGLLFRGGDDEELARHLDRLSHDRELRLRMRLAAWERMTSLWSPRVAAERLVGLCEGLLAGAPPFPVEGPCSPVPDERGRH